MRQYHKIFSFRFFSWIIFSQAPENNFGVISNFFENSRRYLQVKVHRRWQICHRYQRHRQKILPPVPLGLIPEVHFELRISPRFSKKSETALMLSGAWGNWLIYKTWSRKSRGTVPIKGSGKLNTASSTPTTNLRASINNTSGQTFNSWALHWTWWRRRCQQHRQ